MLAHSHTCSSLCICTLFFFFFFVWQSIAVGGTVATHQAGWFQVGSLTHSMWIFSLLRLSSTVQEHANESKLKLAVDGSGNGIWMIEMKLCPFIWPWLVRLYYPAVAWPQLRWLEYINPQHPACRGSGYRNGFDSIILQIDIFFENMWWNYFFHLVSDISFNILCIYLTPLCPSSQSKSFFFLHTNSVIKSQLSWNTICFPSADAASFFLPQQS